MTVKETLRDRTKTYYLRLEHTSGIVVFFWNKRWMCQRYENGEKQYEDKVMGWFRNRCWNAEREFQEMLLEHI